VMLPTWNAKPESRPAMSVMEEYFVSILGNVFSQVSNQQLRLADSVCTLVH
jgi:hypothetical protein